MCALLTKMLQPKQEVLRFMAESLHGWVLRTFTQPELPVQVPAVPDGSLGLELTSQLF